MKQILDLGSGVFDAVTASTIVISLQREVDKQKRDENRLKAFYAIQDLATRKFNTNIIRQNTFYANTSYAFNILVGEHEANVMKKISEGRDRLGKFCVDIIEGIVAHKHLIKKDAVSNSKPLLEGKSIKPYFVNEPKKHIVWKKSEIHRPRPDYLWESPLKIVIRRISSGSTPIVAALDKQRYRTFASVNNLILKDEYKNDYLFLLALLNSRLVNFYYANNFSNNSELTVNISKTYLEQIPIAKHIQSQKIEINETVDQILAITKSEGYQNNELKQAEVKELEKQIDQMVYKLYGLTAEEIAIVEEDPAKGGGHNG